MIMAAWSIYSCTGKKEPSNLRENRTSAKPVTYEEAVKDWRTNKGIGPIKNVELGPVDQELVKQGSVIFENNCSACHLPYKEKIGPAPIGITERRTPEWIMNMILNPAEMVEKHPAIRELLAQFMTPMPNQNLTAEEARAVLEYLRSVQAETSGDGPGGQ